MSTIKVSSSIKENELDYGWDQFVRINTARMMSDLEKEDFFNVQAELVLGLEWMGEELEEDDDEDYSWCVNVRVAELTVYSMNKLTHSQAVDAFSKFAMALAKMTVIVQE